MDFTLNSTKTVPLLSPSKLIEEFPLLEEQRAFIGSARKTVENILKGKDKRFLLIVGPCSLHDLQSAKEYALRLKKLSSRIDSQLYIVMRAYVEKPRTVKGWKGLIHDPFFDESHDFATGLRWAREFLLFLASIQLPAATEFLEFSTPAYLGDLISWGSIGARTSSSPPHRQLASSLQIPIGFKNSLDGDPLAAIQAVLAAKNPQICQAINSEGVACSLHSSGNPYGHIVLRGGISCTNYDTFSTNRAISLAKDAGINLRLLVDCSHGNCQKNYLAQKEVFKNVLEQILEGGFHIAGAMIESHLKGGNQQPSASLDYAVSITDACLSWQDTEELILQAYELLLSRADHLTHSTQVC